jgi:protein-arginine kinase activator protein McsA
LSDLREKLRRAIANEEFELAALLRDQIKVRE